jgi:hypothetical protein
MSVPGLARPLNVSQIRICGGIYDMRRACDGMWSDPGQKKGLPNSILHGVTASLSVDRVSAIEIGLIP